MPRYVAFLRGVMPTNAKMSDLRALFEKIGFSDVKTVLGSGNVVFTTARAASETSLEKKIEAAMRKDLERVFPAAVRSIELLQEILSEDPYRAFKLKPGAKRVVTFLRDKPEKALKLPIELDGARILKVDGKQVYSAYVRSPKGPVFMRLIEDTFGKDVTTRTWDTIHKVTV